MSASTDPVNVCKSILSILALLFSIVVVSALIFKEQTSFSKDIHPAFAFLVFWASLLWLSMVEGGQASMVGLPPIDRKLYERSHPIAHSICSLGHKGDNLNRYLMGRQFMVLALVFMINNSGAPVEDADVLGMPKVMEQIFLGSGLAMILITCMLGQLNTQVSASHCMLDYINTNFMTFTLYVAMAIEASGLLHASYLIQIIVARLSGKPIQSNEPPRAGWKLVEFWSKVVLSCAVLTAAMVFTVGALFAGKTTMWSGVPPGVALFLFFFLMGVVGMLEGMQIAFFAVAKLTEEERNATYWSKKTCELLFRGEGHNLPGFMVGRQLMVVSCFFIIARVTTMEIADGENNVMGVGDGLQAFFGTGLLGALITTILASIAWQLVASAFPMAFLSVAPTYFLLRICLLFQASGICNGAWVIAKLHRALAGFQLDEAYVGTAEERANPNGGDAIRSVVRARAGQRAIEDAELRKLAFRVRTVFSLCLTIFAMIVITVAFVTEKNLFWTDVPWPVQMILLVLDIILLAMLEGVQISLVALKNHPNEAYRQTHPRAYKLSRLIHRDMNLERFLMGRQIFVVVTVFLAARLTTQKDMDELFGGSLPEWFQASLMNTGLLGVVVVAIFGQLTPQIVASARPVEFMEIVPGVYWVCVVCLAFESLGLVHLCYKVANVFIWLFDIKSKMESKDLLSDALSAAQAEQEGDEMSQLRPKVGNKLETLLDVMQRIAESKNVDTESQIFRLAQLRHPQLFMEFPSMHGGSVYASPKQIADQLQQQGYKGETPAFLLPVSDPEHVPPHVFAAKVLAQNVELRKRAVQLKGEQAVAGVPEYGPAGQAIARVLEEELHFSVEGEARL